MLQSQVIGETGVLADRDKIEFRLFNSSSILSRSAVTAVFPVISRVGVERC